MDTDVEKQTVLADHPSEITSEPRWEYSLDLLEPVDIGQALLNTASTGEKFVELVRMAVHQRPSGQIIEVVDRYEELSDSIMSKMIRDMILPTQLRYTLIDGTNTDHGDDELFGRLFALDALDTISSPNVSPADLFVISHKSGQGLRNFNSVVERLIGLANPNAMVLISTPAADKTQEIALATLKTKGLQLVSFIPSGAECLALYSAGSKGTHEHKEALTNGFHNGEVIILEPSVISAEAKSCSQRLRMCLQDQGKTVTMQKGLTNFMEGKKCVIT